MSIHSSVAGTGLVRERIASGTGIVIRWRAIPLLLKLTTMVLLCWLLVIVMVMTVSRTSAIPVISVPDDSYLPGSKLPRLPKDADCHQPQYLYQACVVHLLGPVLYLTFDPNTRMIIRMAIRAREHQIGELIRAWGYPTGFRRDEGSIVVYWGKRSAILYTKSFRPESVVEFIQYDFEAQPASAWRGFRPFEKVDARASG